MVSLRKPLKNILISLLKGYRYLISPVLGTCCRFEPSCSCYAIEAVETYGIFKGLRLTFFRLLKCHPWHAGGYDPVKK
jgi:uncharacterized protein